MGLGGLENAILFLFSYANNAHTNANRQELDTQQNAALAFCQEAKQNVSGWSVFLELFMTSPHVEVQFYCLQTFQELIANGLTDENCAVLRTELMVWLSKNVQFLEEKASFLKNKLAVVFTLLIKRDYTSTRWPNAFSDFMSLTSLGDSMIDIYFKILETVHQDVVEYNIQYSQQELELNMCIKDKMRETTCIKDSFEIIYSVLLSKSKLSYAALQLFKLFISWVDIQLVVNDRFLPIIFSILNDPNSDLRIPAANCLFEIVAKGMDPVKKFMLFENLNLLSFFQNLNFENDEEFLEEIAEVINQIALELIICVDFFKNEKNEAYFNNSLNFLKEILPWIFYLFSHDSKDVSEEVFDTINELSCSLVDKKKKHIFEYLPTAEYLEQILRGISRQIRFSEEIEDEAAFQMYRRNLRKIFINIVRSNNELSLKFLLEIVSNMSFLFDGTTDSSSISGSNLRDLEGNLLLVHHFAEGISVGNRKCILESGLFPEMIVAVITNLFSERMVNSIACSPKVLLVVYDIVVRYVKAIQDHNTLLYSMLQGMLGPVGLCNSSAQIRSRISYLLLRLIKLLKQTTLKPYVADIFEEIKKYITILEENEFELSEQVLQCESSYVPNVSTVPASSGVSSNRSDDKLLTFTDQLYLFEICGFLLGSSTYIPTVELRLQYCISIFQPILLGIEQKIQFIKSGSNDDGSVKIKCVWISCALNALGNIMKGFKKNENENLNGTSKQEEMLTSFFPVMVNILNEPKCASMACVRSKIVFMMHCMIPIMKKEIVITYLFNILQPLILCCEISDAMALIQLLNLLVLKYSNAIMPLLEEHQLVWSVLNKLFSLMPKDTVLQSSEQLDRVLIQKQIASFLLHLAQHGLLLNLEENAFQQLQNILLFLYHICCEVDEILLNRTGFLIIRHLVGKWFSSSSLDINTRTSLIEFVVDKFNAAIFECIKKDSFEMKDLQCQLVLKEIVALQRTFAQTVGEIYLKFLQDYLLNSFQIPAERSNQYLALLVNDTSDKVLQGTFQEIICPWKK